MFGSCIILATFLISWLLWRIDGGRVRCFPSRLSYIGHGGRIDVDVNEIADTVIRRERRVKLINNNECARVFNRKSNQARSPDVNDKGIVLLKKKINGSYLA